MPRLSNDQVKSIRESYGCKRQNLSELSNEFGISEETIVKILKNKIYHNVDYIALYPLSDVGDDSNDLFNELDDDIFAELSPFKEDITIELQKSSSITDSSFTESLQPIALDYNKFLSRMKHRQGKFSLSYLELLESVKSYLLTSHEFECTLDDGLLHEIINSYLEPIIFDMQIKIDEIAKYVDQKKMINKE